MRLADALRIRSNPCETAAKRCLYHRDAGTNCGVGIEVFGSVCIVGIDACSHLLSQNQHFPSSGLLLFTWNLSLLGRGAPRPVGASFAHVVSCAQPNFVSAGQSFRSSIGRKYSSQVTTSFSR